MTKPVGKRDGCLLPWLAKQLALSNTLPGGPGRGCPTRELCSSVIASVKSDDRILLATVGWTERLKICCSSSNLYEETTQLDLGLQAASKPPSLHHLQSFAQEALQNLSSVATPVGILPTVWQHEFQILALC